MLSALLSHWPLQPVGHFLSLVWVPQGILSLWSWTPFRSHFVLRNGQRDEMAASKSTLGALDATNKFRLGRAATHKSPVLAQWMPSTTRAPQQEYAVVDFYEIIHEINDFDILPILSCGNAHFSPQKPQSWTRIPFFDLENHFLYSYKTMTPSLQEHISNKIHDNLFHKAFRDAQL